MNRHCALFNSQCYHYMRYNNCSNIEMFECFNASKLAGYWCVFFGLFFVYVVILLVLKMLVAGKQKYTHKTLREKC